MSLLTTIPNQEQLDEFIIICSTSCSSSCCCHLTLFFPQTQNPRRCCNLFCRLSTRVPARTAHGNLISAVKYQSKEWLIKKKKALSQHAICVEHEKTSPIIQPSKPKFHSPAPPPPLKKNKNTKIKWLRKWGTMFLLCSTWSLARPPTRAIQAFLLPPSPSNLRLNPRFFFSRH